MWTIDPHSAQDRLVMNKVILQFAAAIFVVPVLSIPLITADKMMAGFPTEFLGGALVAAIVSIFALRVWKTYRSEGRGGIAEFENRPVVVAMTLAGILVTLSIVLFGLAARDIYLWLFA